MACKRSAVRSRYPPLNVKCCRDASCVYPKKDDGNPYYHFFTTFLIRNGGREGGRQAVCLLFGAD
jgi:hypothetical protein